MGVFGMRLWFLRSEVRCRCVCVCVWLASISRWWDLMTLGLG